MAGRKGVHIRRQFRTRSVAQRHGHAPRAHRGRVAPRPQRTRAPHAARHLTDETNLNIVPPSNGRTGLVHQSREARNGKEDFGKT